MNFVTERIVYEEHLLRKQGILIEARKKLISEVIIIIKAKKISNNCKKAIFKNIISYVISAIIFFLCSGSISVLRGWIYYILVISGAIINNYILLKYNPEVLNSRGEEGSNTKVWDKKILGIYFLVHIFIISSISGLDVVRYEWSKLSNVYMLLGILLYTISLFICTWAMVINKHFEGTVRVQTEKNHMVISEGPYKYIRHPGNLGMFLASFIQPLIIGSIYAFIPSIFAAIMVVIRTQMEDEMLQKELEGYKEYSQKVNFKLIPKIW